MPGYFNPREGCYSSGDKNQKPMWGCRTEAAVRIGADKEYLNWRFTVVACQSKFAFWRISHQSEIK